MNKKSDGLRSTYYLKVRDSVIVLVSPLVLSHESTSRLVLSTRKRNIEPKGKKQSQNKLDVLICKTQSQYDSKIQVATLRFRLTRLHHQKQRPQIH